MAVLRSKRQIASTEFENTFSKLYRFSMSQTMGVPRRKHKWLCANIDKTLNEAYEDVMSINEYYNANRQVLHDTKIELANHSIELIANLEKPLMIMWNVQGTETKKMASWVLHVNDALRMLYYISDTEGDVPVVSILDWHAIDRVRFMKNMSDLHKYTYGKVINAKKVYDTTAGSLLINLVDDAFYNLVQANKKVPTTKRQYERRQQRISRSIVCLEEMNRALLCYFNIMRYSERIMNEWSDMLVQELRLLRALQKSDKDRFSNLQ